MAGWFLFRGGQVEGPFSPEELVAREGVFPSSKVCAEGGEDWEALADIAPLYAAYQAANSQPAKAARANSAIACHFHPTKPGSVLCSYCSKNLCEECAGRDGERIICRECIAKRSTILEQQEAERLRLAAEKKADQEREAAAKARAGQLRRIFIGIGVVILLVVVGLIVKFGRTAYNTIKHTTEQSTEIR